MKKKPTNGLRYPVRAYAVMVRGRVELRSVRATREQALTAAQMWHPVKKLTMKSVRGVVVK